MNWDLCVYVWILIWCVYYVYVWDFGGDKRVQFDWMIGLVSIHPSVDVDEGCSLTLDLFRPTTIDLWYFPPVQPSWPSLKPSRVLVFASNPWVLSARNENNIHSLLGIIVRYGVYDLSVIRLLGFGKWWRVGGFFLCGELWYVRLCGLFVIFITHMIVTKTLHPFSIFWAKMHMWRFSLPSL